MSTDFYEKVKSYFYGWNGSNWFAPGIDWSTRALRFIGYSHSEIHGGSRFFLNYSVSSLGAMSAPDDMITLSWNTPDTTKWEHFTFYGIGTGGWRMRLVEAPSGGVESPTDKTSMLNHNRNSSKSATCIALDGTVSSVSRDATMATGGIMLWDEYVPGGSKTAGAMGSDREEIVLKQNTRYQLSLYGTDSDPASLHINWYEHTDKER